MPDRELPHRNADPPVTRSELVADLRGLGVADSAVLLVHAALSRLGWVVGGSETVVSALLEAVGPRGTLVGFASWEDNPFHLAEWPPRWQKAYREEFPVFDPARAQARHIYGRLPERIRTWPGAHRSAHPVAGFVAVGHRAQWVTADQDWDDPYGVRSPLGRLVEADGQVLLLGTGIDAMTLLHHAEALASAPGKRYVSYQLPVRQGEQTSWRTTTHVDTSDGAYPYADVVGPDLMGYARGVLAESGLGRYATVGAADCSLFPARALTRLAVDWIESHFGGGPSDAPS